MKNSFLILLTLLTLLSTLQASEEELEDTVMNPPPVFTENDVHKYLGIGAVSAGILAGTVFRPKSDSDYKTHKQAADVATALAVGAVASGLYSHFDDLNVDFGIFDPDNQHIFFGALGTALMVYAVSEAPDKSHAGAGMAGVALMAVSIKITW